MTYLWVFLGAGLGGALRQAASLLALRLFGAEFPIGTLAVNVLGSLAMGAITEWFALRSGLPAHLRLFLTTGILGGFTTFSTFSLDLVTLFERREILLATAYLSVSTGLSAAALVAAMVAIRTLLTAG